MSNAYDYEVDPWVPDDTFGSRLAQIRQKKGWNVKQAALACGVKVQSWHNWEGGRLPREYEDVCRQISRTTGADLNWLLRGWSSRSRCFSQNNGHSRPSASRVKGHLALIDAAER